MDVSTRRAVTASVLLLVLAVLVLGSFPTPVGPGETGSRPLTARAEVSAAAVQEITPFPGCIGETKVLVNSSDPNALVNDGIRMNLTAFASGAFAANGSFQVSMEEKIGSFDAVFGFFENAAVPLTPFYRIFYASNDSSVFLAFWSAELLFAGKGYDFALTRSTGTNWTLSVNGQPFGSDTRLSTFDYKTVGVNGSGNATFSEVAFNPSTGSLPADFVIPLVLAVHRSTGWYVPAVGTAHVCGASPWGIEGRLQHPTLAPDEATSGTQVAPVADGTLLWNTGAVNVDVSMSISPSTVVGTTVAAVSATVTTTSGNPIPGVFLRGADQFAGTFAPSVPVTDSSGSATFSFIAPNVTQNVIDAVTISSGLLGYIGSATSMEGLTPAVHLYVSPTPTTLRLVPSGQASVVFRVTNSSGAPQPNVALTFQLSAAGSLVPAAGVSDSKGEVATALHAPPYPTTIRLSAVVSSPGAWGIGLVDVSVAAGPPFPWSTLIADSVGAGTAALLFAAILVHFRRRRRERRPLPAMPQIGPGAGAEAEPRSKSASGRNQP